MKLITTVKQLAVKHDYYCNESNYYSNEAGGVYGTFSDYFKEFNDADVDMNLVFRWDIKKKDDGTYYMHIFMMGQRKGAFKPFYIELVTDDDVENIIKYLKPHHDKLKQLWTPFK